MDSRIAVFLDRDGTINEDSGYIKDENTLVLIKDSAKAIRLLNENNILTFVCTNQSGVARGYFDEEKVKAINEKLNFLLKQEGSFVDEIYYCPHHIDSSIERYRVDCDCRKPKIGMFNTASSKFNIYKKYVVGDKNSDIVFGNNIGAKSILVLTGYGKKETHKDGVKSHIANNLYDAVLWILKDIKNS